MGETANLKLKTIAPSDNMPVQNFFQDLAGNVATSNMQKIDKEVGTLRSGVQAAKDNAAGAQEAASQASSAAQTAGSTAQSALDAANAAIPATEKGKASGVATLDSSKRVPTAQIPSLPYLSSSTNLDGVPDGQTYKRVTGSEKTTWNNKSNFSGSYKDLTNIPGTFTPSAHNQSAATITSGTFAGKVKASESNEPVSESVLRNCKFAPDGSVDTPKEGEIIFFYEV